MSDDSLSRLFPTEFSEDTTLWEDIVFRDEKSLAQHRKENKKTEKLIIAKETSFVAQTSSGEKVYYTIRPGDNLGTIAEKYRVSVSQIKYWNNIRGTKIVAGKKLVIYPGRSYKNNVSTKKNTVTDKNTNTKTSTTFNGKKHIYKIKSGENLGLIAGKFNVSISNLKKWNNISGTNIKAGDKLVIYSNKKITVSSTNQKKSVPTEKYNKKKKGKIVKYTVVSGDTLWNIAKKYNISVDNLKKLNGLSNSSIKPGMILKVRK